MTRSVKPPFLIGMSYGVGWGGDVRPKVEPWEGVGPAWDAVRGLPLYVTYYYFSRAGPVGP